jgi:uncharacterized protein YjbJ (UPF0337 family)
MARRSADDRPNLDQAAAFTLDVMRSLNMSLRIWPAAVLACTAFLATACDDGSGHAQKTTGHIESAVGSLTGDAKLKREGKKDEVVGGVKSVAGDIKDAAKDATK